MLIEEMIIEGLVRIHGKHPVSTDGGTWDRQACRFLKVRHLFHSFYEKSVIERTIQNIKEGMNVGWLLPCRIKNCRLKHVTNWLHLFIDFRNKEMQAVKWTEPFVVMLT